MDSTHRYEVELQLGKTDEAHVIRTIEYWDIERKRYPQYDHTAVIVAEDITSRFLNVIGLFNGFIPLVAIQLNAIRLGDSISLVFSKVLDEMRLGRVDEGEEVQASTDRAYWEKRANKQKALPACRRPALAFANSTRASSSSTTSSTSAWRKDGQPNNFVIFRPQKDWLRVRWIQLCERHEVTLLWPEVFDTVLQARLVA